MYTRGGAPLEVALKKNIIHLHYDMLLTPEQITPLIVSPRCEGSVHQTAHLPQMRRVKL